MTVAWFNSGATLEVSVAFSYAPNNDLSGASWTDISAYVRDVIDITTGRSAELDAFQAGTISVVLDNRDRRFDPDYVLSPHYPQVKVNTPIRVRLTYSASTSYLGLGFIAGWTHGWERSDNDAVARVIGFDWLKYAARTKLPESIWYADIQALNPKVWYRLGDDDGSTVCPNASLIAGASLNNATYAGPGVKAAGLHYAAGDGSRTVAARDTWLSTPILRAAPAMSSFTPKTVICWLTIPAAPTSGVTQWLWLQTSYRQVTWLNSSGPGESTPFIGTDPRLLWGLNSNTKKLTVEISDGTNTATVESAALTSIFDGGSHMLAVVRTSGGTINFYVDGVLYSGSITSGSTGSTASSLGQVLEVGVIRGEAYTIDEVVAWDSTDLSSSMADLYAAGKHGHSGDTVDERLTRVMDATIYTSAPPRSFETSTITVGGCNFGGGSTTLGAYLATLGTTEGGRVFVDTDGTLTFHNRAHDASSKTVAYAYTDSSGGTYKFASADYENDDSRYRGDVTVSTAGGGSQRSIDTTVTGESLSVSTILDDNEAAKSMADELLYRYSTVRRRIRSLEVVPRSSGSALFPAVRTTKIGTRVSFTRTPVGVGSSWTQNLTVEGIRHSISVKGDWRTSYLTAPTDVSDAWLVINDVTYGLINTNRVAG